MTTFPSSPVAGQLHTADDDGRRWRWTGTLWEVLPDYCRKAIFGLTMSRNAATVMAIAPGECFDESGKIRMARANQALINPLSPWGSGGTLVDPSTGNGLSYTPQAFDQVNVFMVTALDFEPEVNNVFITTINGAGAGDPMNPTIPSAYSYRQYIGSWFLDDIAELAPSRQCGDWVYHDDPLVFAEGTFTISAGGANDTGFLVHTWAKAPKGYRSKIISHANVTAASRLASVINDPTSTWDNSPPPPAYSGSGLDGTIGSKGQGNNNNCAGCSAAVLHLTPTGTGEAGQSWVQSLRNGGGNIRHSFTVAAYWMPRAELEAYL